MALTKVSGSGANGLTLSSTDVTLTSGDLLFATANKGVVLGVTSNTDSNTLDDYEEGNFTATMSNSVTLHSGQDLVSYIKIGRMVTIGAQIRIDNHNSGAATEINNLPFASTTGSENSSYYVGGVRLYNFDVPSDSLYVNAYMGGGASTATFVNNRDNTSSSSLAAVSDGYLMFTLTYLAA